MTSEIIDVALEIKLAKLRQLGPHLSFWNKELQQIESDLSHANEIIVTLANATHKLHMAKSAIRAKYQKAEFHQEELYDLLSDLRRNSGNKENSKISLLESAIKELDQEISELRKKRYDLERKEQKGLRKYIKFVRNESEIQRSKTKIKNKITEIITQIKNLEKEIELHKNE